MRRIGSREFGKGRDSQGHSHRSAWITVEASTGAMRCGEITRAKLLEPNEKEKEKKNSFAIAVGEAALVTQVGGGREVAYTKLTLPVTGSWFKFALCSGSTQASSDLGGTRGS